LRLPVAAHQKIDSNQSIWMLEIFSAVAENI
jgi:hypothetical protein